MLCCLHPCGHHPGCSVSASCFLPSPPPLPPAGSGPCHTRCQAQPCKHCCVPRAPSLDRLWVQLNTWRAGSLRDPRFPAGCQSFPVPQPPSSWVGLPAEPQRPLFTMGPGNVSLGPRPRSSANRRGFPSSGQQKVVSRAASLGPGRPHCHLHRPHASRGRTLLGHSRPDASQRRGRRQ